MFRQEGLYPVYAPSQVADFGAFEARMRNRSAMLGKDKGYPYAEGFDEIVVPG